MKRAISVSQLLKKKFDVMQFRDKWAASLGKPERNGSWIVWGQSGSGKTRFCMELAKYLCKFGRVAYNTLEEGARQSMQRTLIDLEMAEVGSRFVILDREPIAELKERLRQRRSPDFIFIDSFQYTGLNYKQYIQIKEEFPNKLFVWISHAEGKNPEGRAAKKVRYDADIKIHVHAFQVVARSRFGGGEIFTIWEEGARKYGAL